MEAAASTKMLASSYQNIRRYFQENISPQLLYPENHTNLATRCNSILPQRIELHLVLKRQLG
jgi:hypothetical protein